MLQPLRKICDRPVTQLTPEELRLLYRNWLSSNDFESKLARLLAKFEFQAPAVVFFVLGTDRLIVGLPGRHHVIDDARQFVGRGRDGFRSP